MTVMNIKKFSFTYPKVEHPSLRNITLPIKKNKITALIGPSGCGKSTLLRSMNRIHDIYPGNKYEGKIELLDETSGKMQNILDIKKENEFIELRQKIGMIFQKPTPFPMSIFDNVAYGLKIAGVKNKTELADRVETAPLLFTSETSNYFSLDLTESFPSLTVSIYDLANEPEESSRDLAWAASFILTVLVLMINLTGRFITRNKD